MNFLTSVPYSKLEEDDTLGHDPNNETSDEGDRLLM